LHDGEVYNNALDKQAAEKVEAKKLAAAQSIVSKAAKKVAMKKDPEIAANAENADTQQNRENKNQKSSKRTNNGQEQKSPILNPADPCAEEAPKKRGRPKKSDDAPSVPGHPKKTGHPKKDPPAA